MRTHRWPYGPCSLSVPISIHASFGPGTLVLSYLKFYLAISLFFMHLLQFSILVTSQIEAVVSKFVTKLEPKPFAHARYWLPRAEWNSSRRNWWREKKRQIETLRDKDRKSYQLSTIFWQCAMLKTPNPKLDAFPTVKRFWGVRSKHAFRAKYVTLPWFSKQKNNYAIWK